jgi:uncharacterized membrane protein
VGLWAAYRLRRFMTPTEREQILAALAEAGRHTRARIGLTLDDEPTADPQARARHCFRHWNLPEEERSTAVLVYVSAVSRKFAVVGGDAVECVAPRAFWDLVNRDLHHHFDEHRYSDGIFKAIAQVALQLQRHFPRLPAGAAGHDPGGSDAWAEKGGWADHEG